MYKGKIAGEKREKMRKRMTAALLAVCMATGGCGSDPAAKEDIAFTVNGEEIGLREWNFYIRMNQMQWEKEGLDLYGDDMWSQTVAGEEGITRAQQLKEEVMDTICQIHLTNQHAEEYGVILEEEKQQEIWDRAASFMSAYHRALLDYAGADEEFVRECLTERELSVLTANAAVEDYEPEIPEEEIRREGICYVLISTTGLRDAEGNLTPFSEEEVEQRTCLAQEVCEKAREKGDLKEAAEAEGLTPIESSMGKNNGTDGQEPRMLDAARLLEVGEISEPVWTEEGWFVVQHTNDFDEEETAWWREQWTAAAKEEEYERIYGEWKEAAEIVVNQEIMDQVDVKIVLKELL